MSSSDLLTILLLMSTSKTVTRKDRCWKSLFVLQILKHQLQLTRINESIRQVVFAGFTVHAYGMRASSALVMVHSMISKIEELLHFGTTNARKHRMNREVERRITQVTRADAGTLFSISVQVLTTRPTTGLKQVGVIGTNTA